MKALLPIIFVIWIYLLTVFRRTKLVAYHYIWGSIGIFLILITLSNPFWVWELTQMITGLVGSISHSLNWGQSFIEYGGLFIYNQNSSVFLTIDYECSGIIEIIALLSLLIFFPTYSRKEKLLYSLLGSLFIIFANIVRLMTVITIVHFGGSQSFFLAHSIIGRIIFYILTIIVYYYIFTFKQLDKDSYKKIMMKLRKQR